MATNPNGINNSLGEDAGGGAQSNEVRRGRKWEKFIWLFGHCEDNLDDYPSIDMNYEHVL